MVKFLDIRKITQSFYPEIGEVVMRVMDSGFFVRGEEGRCFEEAYASYVGTRYCVGVGNGFDALRLIFRAYLASGRMQEGDEVIVPANTYIASILAVSENRLKPVFVDPDANTFTIDANLIEEKITPRTRGILVVHLYGKNALNPAIRRIAETYSLKIIEDNAQAAGCFEGDRRTGSIGDAAAHSFFPSKNLGALGDAGAVTTSDEEVAALVRTLGNYGSHRKGVNDVQGVNSRLDELQAAVLTLKLKRLDLDNTRRRQAAFFYKQQILHPQIRLPDATEEAKGHVWHLFVVRCAKRSALQEHLKQKGVETLIHYSIPPHKQKAYGELNHLSFPVTEQLHREVLSLPISPVIEEAELAEVAEAVNSFPTFR
jgi:dTDP-4-amino-4,6-dideoxygalactose transaminase